MRFLASTTLALLLAGLAAHGANGATQKPKKPDCRSPSVISSVVGAWRGDPRTPTAFERIDFVGNRGFRIYMGGQVSTKGTWSIDENCVLTARTISSPVPWVFRFERRSRPAMLLLREEGDARPARYSLLDNTP